MSISEKFERAFLCVIRNDRHLLAAQANERSISHRFALYLQSEFPEFDVDCEYNRDGLRTKRLASFRRTVASDDTTGATVYPDVIVHHRGTKRNLAVIEIKTSSNRQGCSEPLDCSCDICKLRAYKSDLGYEHAFYIEFPVGKDLESFSAIKLANYIKEIP